MAHKRTKTASDVVVMNTNARKPIRGETPAMVLVNPKYPTNIGQAWRVCSGFGIRQLWLTGDRILRAINDLSRLPREERMKGYQGVQLIHDERFFDRFDDAVPVCIELREGSQNLPWFEHPENALYIFGPEDGSVRKPIVNECHSFVFIPTHHCLNLACATGIVMYDRRMKRQLAGLEPSLPLNEMLREHRGFISDS